jgi:hypothetical protein
LGIEFWHAQNEGNVSFVDYWHIGKKGKERQDANGISIQLSQALIHTAFLRGLIFAFLLKAMHAIIKGTNCL